MPPVNSSRTRAPLPETSSAAQRVTTLAQLERRRPRQRHHQPGIVLELCVPRHQAPAQPVPIHAGREPGQLGDTDAPGPGEIAATRARAAPQHVSQGEPNARKTLRPLVYPRSRGGAPAVSGGRDAAPCAAAGPGAREHTRAPRPPRPAPGSERPLCRPRRHPPRARRRRSVPKLFEVRFTLPRVQSM